MVEDAQHRHGALQIEGITVRRLVARDDEQHLRPDPVGVGTETTPHASGEIAKRVNRAKPVVLSVKLGLDHQYPTDPGGDQETAR